MSAVQTGSPSETGGQPVATKPRTQPAGTSIHGKTMVPGQTTGARPSTGGTRTSPVHTNENVTRDVELPHELVLLVAVGGDA